MITNESIIKIIKISHLKIKTKLKFKINIFVSCLNKKKATLNLLFKNKIRIFISTFENRKL